MDRKGIKEQLLRFHCSDWLCPLPDALMLRLHWARTQHSRVSKALSELVSPSFYAISREYTRIPGLQAEKPRPGEVKGHVPGHPVSVPPNPRLFPLPVFLIHDSWAFCNPSLPTFRL